VPNKKLEYKSVNDMMQKSYNKVMDEMKNEGKVIRKPPSLRPADVDWFTKNSPNIMATNNPSSGIQYNPSKFNINNPIEIDQTMRHELEHQYQFQEEPWYQPAIDMFNHITGNDPQAPSGLSEVTSDPIFWQRREPQAYQAERDRATKLGLSYPDPVTGAKDIQLPNSRKRIKYPTRAR
jgi:hypothetical protein